MLSIRISKLKKEKDMVLYDIYILQLGFHPIAVEGNLVQN